MLQQDHNTYQGFRTPGIRLTEPLTPSLQSHKTEQLGDRLPAVHEFDKAHLVMLIEEGIIPRAHGTAMLRSLRDMEESGIQPGRLKVQGGVHSGEQYLIRALGEDVGGWIHVGRSTGDLGEVSRRIAIRAHLLKYMDALNSLRQALLLTAPRYFDVVMPGYSGGQNAQPTTYGHWLSMWACVFGRDFDRASELYTRVNQSPAGGAILTGSDFPLNRDRTSALLGFGQPMPHTIDAIHSHDSECLETCCTLAIHASNMMRLADDIQLWSTSEFGFLDVADRFCGTSSIMPQKKNPEFCFRMTISGATTVGAVSTALRGDAGPTGMPLAYMHAVEEALWKVFPDLTQRLAEAADLIPELEVKRDRMKTVAESYWGQAADLAGGIVRLRGLPWRTAHQIVGILVRLSYERGIVPTSVTPELLDEAANLYHGKDLGLKRDELSDLLNVEHSVERRTLYGGPSPKRASHELKSFSTKLEADQHHTTELQSHVDTAHADLESAIDTLITSTPE